MRFHEERRFLFWDRPRVVYHRVYFSIRRQGNGRSGSQHSEIPWYSALWHARGLDIFTFERYQLLRDIKFGEMSTFDEFTGESP